MRTPSPISTRPPLAAGQRGHRVGRASAVLAVSVFLALLVSACGSSGGSGGTGTSGGNPRGGPLLAMSQCMRAHGVSNFPDPSSTGGIQIGPNVDPSSPAFQAAQKHCSKLLPGGGPGGKPNPAMRARLLATSTCMRAHGITGFPDPMAGQPPANIQNYSIALGGGGYFIAVPKSIDVSSPAFKRAAAACQFGVPKGVRTPAP